MKITKDQLAILDRLILKNKERVQKKLKKTLIILKSELILEILKFLVNIIKFWDYY